MLNQVKKVEAAADEVNVGFLWWFVWGVCFFGAGYIGTRTSSVLGHIWKRRNHNFNKGRGICDPIFQEFHHGNLRVEARLANLKEETPELENLA